MKITKKLILPALLSMVMSAYADDVFSNKVVVHNNIASIDVVSNKLSKQNITVKIPQHNATEVVNQKVDYEGALDGYITLAASKLNYQAIITKADNSVLFIANNPPEKKVASNIPTQPVQPTWSYSPEDGKLSVALTRWAKEAGYQLVWKTDTNYELNSSSTITGDFRYALNLMLSSFAKSNSPLYANIYLNKVIVISNHSF